LASGINIGNFSAGESKTITYDADVAGAASFNFGETQLVNTAQVSNGNANNQDIAKVIITKSQVAGDSTGTATVVSTGWTDNIFLDSFFLPLLFATTLIFLFKSRILKIEEWYDSRKKNYSVYKSQKTLDTTIMKSRVKEIVGDNKDTPLSQD
jgi:hypothetical protein